MLQRLGFSVARDMACSSSWTVKGVSLAVTCFERAMSGMSMPLSKCASLVLESAAAEGTAVVASPDSDAGRGC